MLLKIIICYFVFINFVAFSLYGIDKSKAKMRKRRIPEKTLIFVSFIGGCIGAFTGMYFFHHKTRHIKFIVLIPLSIAIYGVLVVYLLWKYQYALPQ